MKVLFCFYPLNVAWSHGVALLSALCKQRGIETELLMLGDYAAFGDCLRRHDVFCFSVVTRADYEKSLFWMKWAHDAGKTVLLGGTWCGLNHPVPEFVHAVCRGDGETLPDFLINGNRKLFDESLVYSDLNELPLPDYEMFSGVAFDRGMPETAGKKVLPYVSSRGCLSRCVFCQSRTQPVFRVRTRVEEDLSEIYSRHLPDLFWIGDATLPYCSQAWRASWGEFRYPFAGYIRADIKPEHLEWLIDRGMVGCAFGVESGNECFRNDVLGKQLSDGQLWRTIEMLQKYKLWYVPFFMYGFPGETMKLRTDTALMERKIGGYPITWKYEQLSEVD